MNNPNAESTQHKSQHINQPVMEMSALVADLEQQTATLIALKSKKGPATPEAKERVKYNALRHGFTGQVLIMTPEEREKFDAFVKGRGRIRHRRDTGTPRQFRRRRSGREMVGVRPRQTPPASQSTTGRTATDNFCPLGRRPM